MSHSTLLRVTSAQMERFLSPLLRDCDRPRQRFLRESIWGILQSGSLVVTEMARSIPDRCRQLFHTSKCLCRQLRSPHWDQAALKEAYLQQAGRWLRQDTVIAVDLTDLAKPHGRAFEALDTVRDGDRDRLTPGYWCLEAYGCLGGGDVLPLLLHPFSAQAEPFYSQPLLVSQQLQRLQQATNAKGIYVMDRGFDGLSYLNPLLDHKMRFILRLRGDRHLRLPSGVHMEAASLAQRLPRVGPLPAHRLYHGRPQQCYLSWAEIRLLHRDEPLWLVSVELVGSTAPPLLLLTNLAVRDRREADFILRCYRQRWRAEQAVQFLKGCIGLEGFRVRSLRAIERLLLLALLAFAFLALMLIGSFRLSDQLIALAQPLPKPAQLLYYRLLSGLQRLLRSSPPHLLRRLQNG